ncbi:MAG: translesion DNA synthesis-associated protein ImuA [Betaproteobacteria bacterium]|nr:translesion DNA synthesis-associated protein ImuA [Betaproteobacteria bacterium]
MSTALESVLQYPGIWRGNQRAQTAEGALPTGYAALDDLLPGGGWPLGALTEVLLSRQGIGELRLLMPTLARLSEADGWLAWVAPPYVPYAAALAAAGVNLERLVVAKPQSEADAWWTAEQALRSGACGALLAWLRAADERRMRRMQLAAETGHSWGVLFRHARAAQDRSPAALRLLLEPAVDGLAVTILKRRGGPVSKPVVVGVPQAGVARRARRAAPVLAAVKV